MAFQYTHNRTLCQRFMALRCMCQCENLNSERVLFHYNTKIHKLQKMELIILPQSVVSYRNTMSKSKEKEKHKDKFTFHLFHYFEFHCSEIGPMPR